jgi:formylglycine-generating enzyme
MSHRFFVSETNDLIFLIFMNKSFDIGLLDKPFYMLRIPGGSYQMGEPTDAFKGLWSQSKPVHKRTIPPFWLGQCTVTQALWKAVLDKSNIPHKLKPEPSQHIGLSRPVDSVSWNDIQIWLKCLHSITNTAYRLPTEAEWEYAARSPILAKQSLVSEMYSGTDYLRDTAWYEENENKASRHCALKYPNAFGLYDITGNVWEWCQDHAQSEYDARLSGSEALELGEKGVHRVMRGGGFDYTSLNCRVSYRYLNPLDFGWQDRGFRLALSLSEGG